MQLKSVVLFVKSNDLVSIILPVYNVEKYLDDCIKSLINQSYKNLEIIFIDDGSTDNSGKILDNYQKKDKRIKVYHKSNGGVSSAKNLGLKHSTGKYITFVDPDDYVTFEYVEYLLNLIKNNNADIAYTKNFFDNYNKKQVDKESISIIDSHKSLYDILTYQINVAVWNKIYRREFLFDNNIKFYEDIFMGEGFNFNVLAFSKANKIVTSNKKIYYYRRDNNTSATTKFKIEKWENALFAIEKIKSNIHTNDKRLKEALCFAEWRTNIDAYTLLNIAKMNKVYPLFNKKTLKNSQKYAKLVSKMDISKKDNMRSFIIRYFPKLLPFLLKIRRRIYRVDVSN